MNNHFHTNMPTIWLRPCNILTKHILKPFNSTPAVHLNMATNIAHATHNEDSGDLSIRAQKRKRALDLYVRKHKKKQTLSEFRDKVETEYYFENGLRKVYPYYYCFNSYVKGRWCRRTILDVYMTDFHGKSEEYFKSEVDRGRILVNGKKVKTDYRLKDGNLIEHVVHRHENPVVGGPLEIIADTPDLVVVNKPASIPCHPCGRYRYNSIQFILGIERGLKNLRTLYRLDRLTSGVLILPKTLKKSQRWEKQLMNKEFYKEYVCRVVGEFPEETVTCDAPLEVLSHKVAVFKVGPKGKPSTTTFTRLSYNGKSSVVKCVPLTGRSHQIRLHLQYLGHPIINDPLYNRAIYGKNHGKEGGVEATEQEIVDDIKKGSNTGLWKLGENPKYVQFLASQKDKAVNSEGGAKLSDNLSGKTDNVDETLGDNKEMQTDRPGVDRVQSQSETGAERMEEQGNNEQVVCSDKTVAGGSGQTSGTVKDEVAVENTSVEMPEKSDLFELVQDNVTEHAGSKDVASELTDEMPSKKIKLDTDYDKSNTESSMESDKVAIDNAETLSDIQTDCVSKSEEDTNGITVQLKTESNNDTDNSNKVTEVTDNNAAVNVTCSDTAGDVTSKLEDHPEEDVKAHAIVETTGELTSESEDPPKVDVVDYSKPCDESKITYEENCEECMHLYKELTPGDLVMYLHALRYKGPDWDFSTPLPDWAQPDWKEDH